MTRMTKIVCSLFVSILLGVITMPALAVATLKESVNEQFPASSVWNEELLKVRGLSTTAMQCSDVDNQFSPLDGNITVYDGNKLLEFAQVIYGHFCRNGGYWCTLASPLPLGTPCWCPIVMQFGQILRPAFNGIVSTY